jgi:ParB/RepB/Spo0J family partition protein
MATDAGATITAPASTELKRVPLGEIRPSQVALRGVNKQNAAYQEIVDSVRQRGVLIPVLLRQLEDPETGKSFYGLVDGLQRFTASQDAGIPDIPAQIVSNMSDADVLENQLVTNAIRVETKPGEFTKQLVRIFQANPLLTLDEMSKKLNRSPGWIQDRLGLAKLDDKMLALVDEGKIPLSNAYVLAKMPDEERPNFLQQAMTMTPAEFAPTANNRVKELREAARQGRKPAESTFVAVSHFQKMPVIQQERAGHEVARALIPTLGPNPDAVQVWDLALDWVLHQDPQSVAAAKAKYEAKQKELADAREKRKAEREAAKSAEATATTAAVTA